MKEQLKKVLDEKRYKHSIGVAEEAKRLAALYGADTDKAYLAGLLHDCAKGYSISEQVELCKKNGVKLDSETLNCPAAIHGFLGAELAKTEYGIDDADVLNSIKYHTVGNAKMTLLEKIVYIADMTEKSRDFDGADELREAVNRDLDEAVFISVRQQFMLQYNRRGVIHPNMIYMWNDLILNKKQEKRD